MLSLIIKESPDRKTPSSPLLETGKTPSSPLLETGKTPSSPLLETGKIPSPPPLMPSFKVPISIHKLPGKNWDKICQYNETLRVQAHGVVVNTSASKTKDSRFEPRRLQPREKSFLDLER